MFMRRVRMMGVGGGARKPTNEEIARAHGIGIKKGAIIKDLMPGLVVKFPDIAKVWKDNNEKPVITSGSDDDPNRVEDSDHNYNMAIDFRGRDMGDDEQDKIAEDLKKALGPNYYVESEHPINKKTGEREEERDHIHISYRPKITIGLPSVNV